jgi:uncharacterized protein
LTDRIDRRGLIRHLRAQFSIDWRGHHGISHWARVRLNGLTLARLNGANAHVVELFAFFHDARRQNEHTDDGHGNRGAVLAMQLQGRIFEASAHEMDLLVRACQRHSDGELRADLTVMTCWDADRLDLGRVGIMPDPRYLCTAQAKDSDNLRQAHARSIAWRQRMNR